MSAGIVQFGSMFSQANEVAPLNDGADGRTNPAYSPVSLRSSVNVAPNRYDGQESGSLQCLGFSLTIQTLDIAPLSIVDTVQTVNIQPSPTRFQSVKIERRVSNVKQLDVQLKKSVSATVLKKVLVLENDDGNGMEKSRQDKSNVAKCGPGHSLRNDHSNVHAKVSPFENGSNWRADSTLNEEMKPKRVSVKEKASLFGKVCVYNACEDSSRSEENCISMPKNDDVLGNSSLFGKINVQKVSSLSEKIVKVPEKKKNAQAKASLFEKCTERSDSSLDDKCDVLLKKNGVLVKAPLSVETRVSTDEAVRVLPKKNRVQARASMFEKTDVPVEKADTPLPKLLVPSVFDKPETGAHVFLVEKEVKEKNCSPIKGTVATKVSAFERSSSLTKTLRTSNTKVEAKPALSKNVEECGLLTQSIKIGIGSNRMQSEMVDAHTLVPRVEKEAEEMVIPSRSSKINVQALVSRFENCDEQAKPPPRSETWNTMPEQSQLKTPPQSKTLSNVTNKSHIKNHEGNLETDKTEVNSPKIERRSEKEKQAKSEPVVVLSNSSPPKKKVNEKEESESETLSILSNDVNEQEVREHLQPSRSGTLSILENISQFEKQNEPETHCFSSGASETDGDEDNIATPPPRRRRSRDESVTRSTSLTLLNLGTGMSPPCTQAIIWRRESSHGSLTSPVSPKTCTLPAHYEAECAADDGISALSSESSFQNPSSRVVEQVISVLTRAHSLLDNRTVRRAHICSDFDLHYSDRSVPGWECGHLCASSMISSLLLNESMRSKLQEADISDTPDIIEVAELIERAWAAGFDVDGAEKYSGTLVGRHAYLGATEVAVLLLSLGVPACTRAFPAKTPLERRFFFDWVLTHFERSCSNVGGCSLHRRRRRHDNQDGEVIVPLFISWPKRACLVVGAERIRTGDVRLLVIEPIAPCADGLRSRRVKKRVVVVRRGESHPQWSSSQQYHVVYVEQKVKNDMKVSKRFAAAAGGTHSFSRLVFLRRNSIDK